MINVVSLGAGKQSSYMLINGLRGAYQHKPDIAIFSDTGCEPQYVYEYLYWLDNYLKKEFGFRIIRVKLGNIMQDTIDYIDRKVGRVASLPLRLSNNGGLLPRQCTHDYKISPLRKYLRHNYPHSKFRLWMGISMDEIERMRYSNVKYITNYYPLIENRTPISSIINWYKQQNLPEPGKSACIICPFHSSTYWAMFKKQYPEEFETACIFDEKIRNFPKIRQSCFLAKQLMPLRDIDFTISPTLFPDLIEECEGLCGL